MNAQRRHKGMANEYVIRWKETEEKKQPSSEPVRNRGHSDPTADAAIGHIIAEEKRERRRKERQWQKKNRYKPKDTGRPRTSVWRKSDEEDKNGRG